MEEKINNEEQEKVMAEQRRMASEGKRGHCIDMAIRVSKPEDDADAVLEKAKKFFDFIENG